MNLLKKSVVIVVFTENNKTKTFKKEQKMAENKEEFPTKISNDMFIREVPTDNNLGSLRQLAEELQTVQRDRLEAETLLKALKERERQISESDLPLAMQEIGMNDFTLTDGKKVAKKTVYRGHIRQDNMLEALEYLNSQGYQDAMKNELKASTSPNMPQSEFKEIQKLLRENFGVEFDQKLSIHHSTMSAVIRKLQEDIDQQSARGENPKPIDSVLNPFIVDKVTIK